MQVDQAQEEGLDMACTSTTNPTLTRPTLPTLPYVRPVPLSIQRPSHPPPPLCWSCLHQHLLLQQHAEEGFCLLTCAPGPFALTKCSIVLLQEHAPVEQALHWRRLSGRRGSFFFYIFAVIFLQLTLHIREKWQDKAFQITKHILIHFYDTDLT